MGLTDSWSTKLRNNVARPVAGALMLTVVGGTDIGDVIGFTSQAFAHSAAEGDLHTLKTPQLGTELFQHAALELFSHRFPEDLDGYSKAAWKARVLSLTPLRDASGHLIGETERAKQAIEKIEKAFADAFAKMEPAEAIQSMLSKARNGDRESYDSVTTDAGHKSMSVINAIEENFYRPGWKAAIAASKGKSFKGSQDYKDTRDVLFRGFILDIARDPSIYTEQDSDLGGQTVFDAMRLESQRLWQEGFKAFVKNTLEPKLSLQPVQPVVRAQVVQDPNLQGPKY